MRFQPGVCVVLEGLDRAGKTTQRESLASLPWADPQPITVHMPSGLTTMSRAIYDVTESAAIDSALARQLLHLACHAENLPKLQAARRDRGVLLDRWWWSTVAYGWFAGGLRTRLKESIFFGLIDSIWGGFSPDLVFLFLTPFDEDALNVDLVSEGYRWLRARDPSAVVDVPSLSPEETTGFLSDALQSRGLVT